ncbi:MAG TPA: thioredoxin domain-containing protein, partial [Rhodopila sp.]
EAVLTAFGGQADQLAGMPTLLAAADMLSEAASVVVVGNHPHALIDAGLRTPDPAAVVLRATDMSALPAAHPAYGKTSGADDATAYVCRRQVCGLPIRDAAMLSGALRTRL